MQNEQPAVWVLDATRTKQI